jgi:hypothetical protein
LQLLSINANCSGITSPGKFIPSTLRYSQSLPPFCFLDLDLDPDLDFDLDLDLLIDLAFDFNFEFLTFLDTRLFLDCFLIDTRLGISNVFIFKLDYIFYIFKFSLFFLLIQLK